MRKLSITWKARQPERQHVWIALRIEGREVVDSQKGVFGKKFSMRQRLV